MVKTDCEKYVDLKTIQAMEDVKAGRSEPIDDLLEMIEEDKNWLEENKTAIDNYNERIQRDGIFGSCKRRF
ncbi:MAG: type II toxin-antitoxin system CcdA family antitoxin [Pedobacter sp.]